MKMCMLIVVVLTLCAFTVAQIGAAPAGDVLGAHLNYGRGCAACHAPHGGAYGNGAAKTAQSAANSFLWGQDTSSLLGQTITLSGGVVEVLPSSLATAGRPDVTGILLCLSCHDGNYATGAMMQNKVYETLPSTYGTFNSIPTLLADAGALGVGNYTANHPVGLNAVITCGGQFDWDCIANANGTISMTGANSARFVINYGFFVQPGAYGSQAIVLCTTCHNQHLMNVVSVVTGQNTGLPTGYYQTMFFIRAPYNPASTTLGSNQTAQFCRQCHGSLANEANNGQSPTVF